MASLQRVNDPTYVNRKGLSECCQPTHHDVCLRGIQRCSQCMQQRVRIVRDPRGDLVSHLSALLAPWTGCWTADAAFRADLHTYGVYLSSIKAGHPPSRMPAVAVALASRGEAGPQAGSRAAQSSGGYVSPLTSQTQGCSKWSRWSWHSPCLNFGVNDPTRSERSVLRLVIR